MIGKVIGHIEENNRNKYLVFMIFQIKTKRYLKKNTQNVGMILKMKFRQQTVVKQVKNMVKNS